MTRSPTTDAGALADPLEDYVALARWCYENPNLAATTIRGLRKSSQQETPSSPAHMIALAEANRAMYTSSSEATSSPAPNFKTCESCTTPGKCEKDEAAGVAASYCTRWKRDPSVMPDCGAGDPLRKALEKIVARLGGPANAQLWDIRQIAELALSAISLTEDSP
jgi:hypothetical protein